MSLVLPVVNRSPHRERPGRHWQSHRESAFHPQSHRQHRKPENSRRHYDSEPLANSTCDHEKVLFKIK